MPVYWMDVLGGVSIGGSALVLCWGLRLCLMPFKGAVLTVLRGVVLMQLLGIASGVAILVQQQIGPVYLLLMAFSTCVMTGCGALFIGQFLKVQSKSLSIKLPNEELIMKTLNAFPILGGGPFFIGAFGGFATINNASQYNLVICAMLFVSPILQVVSAPILNRSTNSLIAVLESVNRQRPPTSANSSASKQEHELLLKLKAFRNQNISSMMSYMLTTPVLAIIYLCLGTLPYMWIITFFLAILNVVVGASFFIFMRSSFQNASSKHSTASGAATAPLGVVPVSHYSSVSHDHRLISAPSDRSIINGSVSEVEPLA